MNRVVFTFLLASTLFLVKTTATLNDTTEIDSVSDGLGIVISLQNHNKNVAFKQRINLIPFSKLNITVIDVPTDIWFIILQVHTFQYNATIAYNKALLDKVSDKSLFGSNIGLYLKTHNVITPIQVFLKHKNIHNLDALLVIVAYDRNAPIPGGCNMEFDIEIAPYRKLHTENEMIIVDTQKASILGDNGLPTLCETNPVQHKMYRLYLPRRDFTPDTYFEAIASMLTTQDIVRNGDEIPVGMNPMRRIYSTYIGTGSVYAAVATYGNYSSAYIPIVTYSCSPLLYPETCQVLNDTFAKMICALVLIIGFLLIIIGHKYTYADRIISSCMIGGIFGYTLTRVIGEYNIAINILIGLIFAIAVTLWAFLCLTYELGTLCYLSFLANLPLGFLCACIGYLYAPAWMFYILENDFLFWPMFVSLMLIVAIPLTKMPHIAKTLTRVVFGSYFVIIAMDYYTGSNLKYIILNLIRRITISEFHLAFVYPPYQDADIILIIIWLVLIIVQFIIQGCAKLCDRRTSLIATAEDDAETTTLLNANMLKKKFYGRRYYRSKNRYKNMTYTNNT